MEKALLVTIKLDSEKDSWPLKDSASELEELTAACGVEAIDNVSCLRVKPTANFFIGKGIVLSRLGGGIGTRGPGEQKLEVDRRRIRKRIDRLKDDLRHMVLHRV